MSPCNVLDMQSIKLSPEMLSQAPSCHNSGRIYKCNHLLPRARYMICSHMAGEWLTETLVCRQAVWNWNLEMHETI